MTWSPDGRRLAFQALGAGGDTDVFSIRADGTDRRSLTGREGFDMAPTWSPDSEWIAYLSDRGGDTELYLIRPDGTGERRLPFSAEAGGVWFRGGQQGNRPLIGRVNPVTLTIDETLRLDRTVIIDGTIDPGTGTMWLTNLRRIVTRVDLRPDPEEPVPSEEQSDSPGSAKAPTPEVTDVLRLTKPEEGLLGAEIAVGEGSVWVPLHEPGGVGPASILRIDSATNEVVAEIPVPGGPADLTVGAGSVWVVGYGEGRGHVWSSPAPHGRRSLRRSPWDGEGCLSRSGGTTSLGPVRPVRRS
ncbi:MAG: TolB family protein [Actinomycetota bacterium]